MKLIDHIRDIKDFPTPGILFKDITPLLGNKTAFAKAAQELLELIGDQQIDKVVGVESRGFFFGGVLAEKLNAGFVPVRKPGKLPHTTVSQTYALEYGTDTLEIHKDAIQPGDKVLVHDDVLATGGTAQAVVKLIEALGGEVVQCNFLIELSFLSGKEKLQGQDIKAVITY
ncbi:adenine phosphoribosyltransferase [Dokdonia ponticola]|uniref:Adenine phosphoribosyltransferase n=1 Tax=Dokdonia ponticola TaxID=2041041 RepID=A0ABV9HTG6_9FLAO